MSSAAGRIIGLYEDNAAAWDAGRGGPLFEQPWLDRFLAGVPAGGTILDLGCGSGRPIAGYFVSRGRRVVGVDASPSLIALCRERFADETWIVADMRTLELGRPFGGLIAWHSFFHLTPDDQRAMFPVFRDHVEPGGVLMFTSGHAHGEVIGRWRGEALYHGSLDPAEYRALLDAHGFELIDHAWRDPAFGEATIWLARRR